MVICPLCKNKSKLIWKEKKYKVYKCFNCKVAFLYPFPDNPEKIYSEDYFKKWYLPYYKARKKYFKNLLKKIEIYLPEKGKILDIGCGVGIFLDLMKEEGWDVYGQDVSSFAVEYCRDKGYKIYKNLSEIIGEGIFDVITMFDVIAHIPHPFSYISKCYKLMKKKGVLIIKTPYHTNFLFMITKILSFTGKSKSLLHIPVQIYHFAPPSLKILLEKEKFAVKDILYIKDFFSDFSTLKNVLNFFIRENSIVYIFQKNG